MPMLCWCTKQGRTLADIITRAVNQSGRLNLSFPRNIGNSPSYYNHFVTAWEESFDKPGSPSQPKGYYIFDTTEPLWNFGYGLSYTKYVSCTVKNLFLQMMILLQ